MLASRSRLLSLVLLLPAVITGCWAYSAGAPEQACNDLTPSHGVDSQPAADFPYQLTVSPDSIQPGGRVTLTIGPRLLGARPIKGFFVQARDAQSPEESAALGQFVDIDALHQPVNCGAIPASGITHRNSEEKRVVTVTWQSPADLAPGRRVVFLVTVVQQRDTFWAGLQSDVVTVLAGETTTPAGEMTTPAGEMTTPAGGDSSAGSSCAALVALLATIALLRTQ